MIQEDKDAAYLSNAMDNNGIICHLKFEKYKRHMPSQVLKQL